MWTTKYFKTLEALQKWIDRNKNKVQYTVIFITNGYGVEYKPLKQL